MNQDKIKTIIEHIFAHTGCTVSSCTFTEDAGMLWCVVETPDSRFIIGRDGETLRSLNHLVRKMLERDSSIEEVEKVIIDVNGYQKKRYESLKNIAHMMAERARYFKSSVEVDPMPASERRIIHMYLENSPNIKTESEGSGPHRRVVIKYVDTKVD
jgi:spoIIIJ-associated protein